MYKFYTRKLGVSARLYHKIWVIMRLTTVILIASLMQVSAATLAQRITLNQQNVSLKVVLKEIRKQSGYDFYYDGKIIPASQQVNVNVLKATIEETLQSLFKDLPYTYEINNKDVTIKKKIQPSFLDNINAALATIDVHGRVVDEKGQPLPGVTVKLKDESQVTTTDKEGDFFLKKVNEKSVLVISFVGFLTKEINAAPDLGTISLEISNSKLDEVQVIAYGKTSIRFSTSNIGVVKAEDITKQPVANPILALSGRVTGLFIQQGSGVTASSPNVLIQGKNSIGSGVEPFYVIDGIPYLPTFTSSSLMGGAISGSGGSSFNFLNSSDIESITVLKDADATSIYGSRAANGAILITTKKGKAGKTKVDVNMQSGFGNITRKLDLLNTQQYLELRKEFYKNNGEPIPNSQSSADETNFDLTRWDQNKYTDWQKTLIGGTAKYTDIQASVSGGNANTQFLAGYGFHRETTVYPGDLADQKGSVHFNITHKSNDNRFNYLLTGSYLQDENTLNSLDLTNAALNLAPNAPDLFNNDGSLNWEPIDGVTTASFNNPLSYTKQRYKGNTGNLIANNSISYKLFDNLLAKVDLGFNKLQGDESKSTPITYYIPISSSKTYQILDKTITSYVIEPQISYTKETKYGIFDILLGSTFQNTNSDVFSETSKGYTNDAQLGNLSAATSISIDGGGVITSKYKYNALFSRLNYRFKDRYILNLTLRRDGSSRFGNENKLNNFYSLGSAWIFTEETFFKQLLPVISFGKLRVNYGTTGNDQIGDYNYLSLLDTYYTQIPYQESSGLYPTRISNPYLQWEETKKLNIGINLGFLKDRVTLDVNYFRNRSSNQLLNYGLPSTTGFTGIAQNFPATLQNSGLEMLLDVAIVKSQKFSWQTSINLTVPKNKLLSFTDFENSTYVNRYVIGQSINVRKVFEFAGVNENTGLYQFVKNNGELTSTPDNISDKTQLLNTDPKFYGGLANTVRFGPIQLDFLFQFVKQLGFTNKFGNYPGFFYSLADQANQPISVLDRWKTVGNISPIQKAAFTDDVFAPYDAINNSTAAFTDASFIRLKNLSLSYSFPSSILKGIGINSARMYIQGQNVLTFTKFPGDPETQSFQRLPTLRMYTIGMQITL